MGLETVILVHGLWMTGLEMGVLRYRLRRGGFHALRFSYQSLRVPLAENIGLLQKFVERQDAPVLHFVGHSLGGVVILRMFQQYPAQHPGRIVLLGSPLKGCHAARHLSRTAFGRLLLGRSLGPELLEGLPDWDGRRELGIIAGTMGIGMGRLVGGGVPVPNDGTVAVCETELPGATAHIRLPVTHMSMLVSADVARQVCAFLRAGQFLRMPAQAPAEGP